MVSGSTLRYGSHFWRVTFRPRLSSRHPIEAAATPFPSEETTPPVTKMYFGAERKVLDFLRKESAYSTLWSQCWRVSNHDFDFVLEKFFAGWYGEGRSPVWLDLIANSQRVRAIIFPHVRCLSAHPRLPRRNPFQPR